jgi:hypothetical protein
MSFFAKRKNDPILGEFGRLADVISFTAVVLGTKAFGFLKV